jgi:hypothetical protein
MGKGGVYTVVHGKGTCTDTYTVEHCTTYCNRRSKKARNFYEEWIRIEDSANTTKGGKCAKLEEII